MLKIIPHAAAQSVSGSLVIALHCSGGTGYQWQKLRQALGPPFKVISPNLIGCGDNPHWNGKSRFKLTDEARPIVESIDTWNGPVHLVGHSYGGTVALRVAVERPARIASLSLYEPTAFHVLKATGEDGKVALKEISVLAAKIRRFVVAGAGWAAARCFVDYWNRPGTFEALNPDAQADLVRYIPKAFLDFRAAIEERVPLVAYRRLRAPLRLMIGETAPLATELPARKLSVVMNPGALRIVKGAGHMGPQSHSNIVVKMVVDNIAASDPSAAWYRTPISPTPQAA